jgi:hypothetical protein
MGMISSVIYDGKFYLGIEDGIDIGFIDIRSSIVGIDGAERLIWGIFL